MIMQLSARIVHRSKTVAIILISTIPIGKGFPHEGHQPLPTKGVQVDLLQGTIALSAQARKGIGVEAIEVSEEKVSSTFDGYAETAIPWNSRATVSTQLAGRVVNLLVQPGVDVKAGQVLAEIASRDLDNLRFEYRSAVAMVQTAENQMRLTRPAVASGSIPQRRLLDLENELERARLALSIAQIKAKLLNIDDVFDGDHLADSSSEALYPIRAPIDGTIIHSDLSEGKFVEADEHLFEIADSRVLWGKVRLLEKDLPWVQVGDQVEFRFLGKSEPVVSTIAYLDPHLDPITQNAWAWGIVTGNELLAGMSGTAIVYGADARDAISIPRESLFSDGMQNYVLVEEASTKGSGEYRKRVVRIGKRRGGDERLLEILTGDIYPGDRVVTRGGHELSSLLFRETLKLDEEQRQHLGVELQAARIEDLYTVVRGEGVVALPPGKKATLTSQLTANIRAIHAVPGKTVLKGEVVLELFGTELQTLQLDLLQTALNLELVQQRISRLEQSGGDAVALRTILEERGTLALEQVRFERQKKELSTLGFSSSDIESLLTNKHVLSVLPVRSPIDGRIAVLNCTLGQTTLANQPLVEVHSTEGTWIETKIPAQHFEQIRVGSQGYIQLLATPEVQGRVRVVRMSPEIEEATRSRTIWLEVEPGEPPISFREGMMVSVQLQTDQAEPHLAIPSTALVRDGLNWFTFVKRPDEVYERRRVVIGKSDTHFTQIISGIEESDTVVSQGAQTLQSAFATLR